MTALSELLAKQKALASKASGVSAPVSSDTKTSIVKPLGKPVPTNTSPIASERLQVQAPLPNKSAIPDQVVSPGCKYFHSSIANFKFYVANGKFGYFKDHHCITSDPDIIKTIETSLLTSVHPTATIKVKEISAMSYNASQIVEPSIEPLPEQ